MNCGLTLENRPLDRSRGKEYEKRKGEGLAGGDVKKDPATNEKLTGEATDDQLETSKKTKCLKKDEGEATEKGRAQSINPFRSFALTFNTPH